MTRRIPKNQTPYRKEGMAALGLYANSPEAKRLKAEQRARAERLVDMTKRERQIEQAERAIDPVHQQEKLLVEAYMTTKNMPAAARLAEFPDGVDAESLFNRPSVRELLAQRRSTLSIALDITPERILRETAVLAFSNIVDYTQLNEEGDRVIDLSATPDELLAAVQTITTQTYMDGDREVKRTTLKLHNKRDSLLDLGRKFGVFEKTTEHNEYRFTLNLGSVGDQHINTEMQVRLRPADKAGGDNSPDTIEGELLPPKVPLPKVS